MIKVEQKCDVPGCEVVGDNEEPGWSRAIVDTMARDLCPDHAIAMYAVLGLRHASTRDPPEVAKTKPKVEKSKTEKPKEKGGRSGNIPGAKQLFDAFSLKKK